MNQLERQHRGEVPSPQLDGAVVEMLPSCPAGRRASAWLSEQRSLGPQLPNVNFASAMTAQSCRLTVPLHVSFPVSEMRIILF